MGDTKERVVRVEIPREDTKVSGIERQIRVEVPAGIELSEEEIRKVASATQNEIVDVIRGVQAKQLAAMAKAKQEVVVVKSEVVVL